MLVKEELVQYLTKGYIHVSRQDYLFFNNLIRFSNEGTVTTGQDKLLNKLIDKYQKQLRKENLDIESLKTLPWLHPIVETLDTYRKAYVKIIDKEIVVKNPFSKKFMQDLQRLGASNTLEWDKSKKLYRAPFSTYMLKHAIDLVVKNFDEVEFCSTVQNILNEVQQYNNCYWNPTLVEVHGHYYIAACNQQLYDCTLDVILTNDPRTFFELSKRGISVDKNIKLTSEASRFATSYHYEMDIDQVDDLIDCLKAIDITSVLVEHQAIYTNSLYKELRHKLEDNGIKVVPHNDLKYLGNEQYPVLMTFRSRIRHLETNRASKIVYIKNSRPITVR